MTCSLKVLGCSGGIGKDLRTTSFLLNDNILIDAGTGVGDLSLVELRKIDYLFLTHSHLDHICSLPFILDAVGVNRKKPLKVFGIKHTIDALKQHILNDVIWPDFTKIPNPENPSVMLEVIEIGQTININNIEITALPLRHSIPGNAYWLDSKEGALVFSGDTGSSPEFWQAINLKSKERKDSSYLKHLIIETSFTNAEMNLAKLSGHYHPAQLLEDLKLLEPNCPIWITHLKPDEANKIMQELASHQDDKRQIKALQNHQILHF